MKRYIEAILVSWGFIDKFWNFPCVVERVTKIFTHCQLEIELKTDIFTNFFTQIIKNKLHIWEIERRKWKKFLISLSHHLVILSIIIVIIARWMMFKKRFDFLRFLRFLSSIVVTEGIYSVTSACADHTRQIEKSSILYLIRKPPRQHSSLDFFCGFVLSRFVASTKKNTETLDDGMEVKIIYF